MYKTWSISTESGAFSAGRRGSVLDTLLLRHNSASLERSMSARSCSLGDGGSSTPFVESDASSDGRQGSLLTAVLSPDHRRETCTPTTRAEQLAILLARNYHSAPACSLAYVGLTSSIRFDIEEQRDSEATLADNRDGESQTIDSAEVNSSAASSSGLSLLSERLRLDACESASSSCSIDSYSATSRVSGSPLNREDDPICDCVGEVATSPAYALVKMHNASQAGGGGGAYADPPMGRIVHRRCVDACTSPIDSPAAEPAPASLCFSVSEGVDASTSPIESAKKSIPVYSRSLLYRIRVPLAQRLRNACANFGEVHRSPGASGSRANLSCSRRSVGLRLETHLESSESSHESAGSSPLNSASGTDRSRSASDGGDSDVTPAAAEGTDAEGPKFRKKLRWVTIDRHSKRRRTHKTQPSRGLVVSGELWSTGAMKYIGPEADGVAENDDGSGGQMPLLNRMLAKHVYLCSEPSL